MQIITAFGLVVWLITFNKFKKLLSLFILFYLYFKHNVFSVAITDTTTVILLPR